MIQLYTCHAVFHTDWLSAVYITKMIYNLQTGSIVCHVCDIRRTDQQKVIQRWAEDERQRIEDHTSHVEEAKDSGGACD